jgi:oxygen-dependent protoporphyrinogen oxidase
MDLVLPRGPAVEDESVGAFVRRRLGREALERIAEPVLSGVYLGRADELSLHATWPALPELEREHRSVILGMRRSGGPDGFAPRRAVRDGLSRLVEGIAAAMPQVEVRTNAAVRRIEPAWKAHLEEDSFEADAVILAVPAPRAADLVGPWAPALAGSLRRLRYASSATVSLGFRGRPPFDGTSLFIGPSEGLRLAAVTFSSEKFEGRAPGGHWLVRCFLRGAPAEAARIAREELRGILGVSEEPVLERTSLWPDARPVYEVGHEVRVREIERLTPAGLHLAGSAYRGLSLPDCIRDARRAAERILAGM